MAVAILGTVGTVVGSNSDLRDQVVSFFKPSTANLIPFKVIKQRLDITVTERGSLESSKNEDVANEVEGQTTIIKILPEGTPVKKGDLVCELDSATLRDNQTNQEIVTQRAAADLENADKTLQVAEISVEEYKFGIYTQDSLQLKGEKTLADSELERAEDRLKWSERMLGKEYLSEGQVMADRLAKLKAEISKEQATNKISVLEKYTKVKQLTELQANVKKAEADRLSKKATHDLENTKLLKLIKMIEKCKLFAPNDGLIVYATDNQMFRQNQATIEEGATVRERQKIFSLPDITKMQVNAKVHESMVDRVKATQNAKIKVDAFPNVKLTGTVKTVNPLPDQANFLASDVKVYTTIITINETYPSLRPGMTAEVTVLINTLNDVLCIPVTAVFPFKGKDYVYLIPPNGPAKRTEVKLGDTNDIMIEIKEGVKENDLVAMNPTSLLTETEKNEAFSSSRIGQRERDFGDVKNPPTANTGAPDAKGGDAKAKAKGKKGAGGGNAMAVFQKIRQKTSTLPPEDQDKLKDFSLPMSERQELMKKAGVTDEEIQQMTQAMQQFRGGGEGGPPGGGRGPGGPGGGGPPQ